ncbi:Hypothetical_protein [Hexamita inflata]|uniref:Hypothetical_protein n=1 Tax=Hexamita inflata TaxID=28002 RepID=A0AA86QD88_9EUKA|nr:Hypothetical protein HINF_LOCUS37570 [Hexamita inflata]
MPIKLPIDSINTQIVGGPSENTRGQQFGVLIHFILSPVILNATFRFQNFHKLLRQFSLAPQGQGISIWIQIACSQHLRLTEGIDIERIFRANEIRYIKILLLFLILNQLRGFCSRCRNRVQNIIFFLKLIIFIVLLSTI